MFEYDFESDGFLAWLIQQVLAPVVPLAWVFAAAPLEQWSWAHLTPLIGDAVTFVEIVWNFIFVWSSGFLFGLLVQTKLPRAVYTGRWVWILPTVLYVCLVLREVAHRGITSRLLDLFVGTGEKSWAVWFFTFPTVSCILYSFGVILAHRWRAVRAR